MLNNFFKINFPYGISQNEKGEWFAFNREYLPLGYNDVHTPASSDLNGNLYGNLPIYTCYKGLTETLINKIIAIDSDSEEANIKRDTSGKIIKVFFYSDGSNPVNVSGNVDILWKNYFDKLKLLSKLEVSRSVALNSNMKLTEETI